MKNPPVTAHVSHSVLRMPLSRELLVILLLGKRPQHVPVVFQQGPPLWCEDPPSRLPEDRRQQRDCQSLIISNASLRYLVSFDSHVSA